MSTQKRGDWDIDLALGEVAEEDVRNLLRGQNHIGERVTIEVKNDRLTHKTGNCYFEFECAGKPSGLATTKSDWYWYTMAEHVGMMNLVVNTRYLKDTLRYKYRIRKAVPKEGGDFNASKGYLISLSDLVTLED